MATRLHDKKADLLERVIDRVLAQARLGSQLRVDEAGTPFLWITH